MKSERQKCYDAMDRANGIKVKIPIPSIAKLKEVANDLCSVYVRRRDADSQGMVQCYTCPRVRHWKQMHAGHLIPGRGNSILLDATGMRPQCRECNCEGRGMPDIFMAHLQEDLGVFAAERIHDDLRFRSKKPYSYKREELEALIEWFKRKIDNNDKRC